MKSRWENKKLGEISRRINFLENELERIQQIGKEINGALWKYCEEKIKKRLNQIDSLLYDFIKLADKSIFSLLSEKRALIDQLSLRDYVKEEENFIISLNELRKQKKEIGSGTK